VFVTHSLPSSVAYKLSGLVITLEVLRVQLRHQPPQQLHFGFAYGSINWKAANTLALWCNDRI